MSASACLRISLELSEEKLAKLEGLGPLVSKVTSAFLESRWSWPKKYQAINPFSFMLTDPKSAELDVVHLERLAEELQLRLFGTSDAGDVTLLLFDGDEVDTAQFVRMEHADLSQALREPIGPTPFGGRLMKISTDAEVTSGLRWRTLEREAAALAAPASVATAPAPAVAEAEDQGPALTFRGIYFAPAQAFVGSSLSADAAAEPGRYSLLDSATRLPHGREEAYDIACLNAAHQYLLARPDAGPIYLPVCYSSLMRRSTRETYARAFRALADGDIRQLAAVVYDVPRAPPFSALGDIRELLRRHFATIDLQVDDAGFEIDGVPPGAVNSVTLRLPDAAPAVRIAALRRFMEKRDAFKRRKIWPSITNIRNPAELEACLRERVPFLTGPAVCGPMAEPVARLAWQTQRLPLMRAA
jgi:hypothetical protein